MKPYVISISTSPSRLPEETSRAYAKFSLYRDMGPNRSLDLTWQAWCLQHGKTSRSAKHPGSWGRLSQQYNWVERAEEYDQDQKEAQEEAQREERDAAYEELRARRLQFALKNQKRLENQARGLALVAENAYKVPLSRVTRTITDPVSGVKTVTQIGPLNLGQLANHSRVQNETGTLALGGNPNQPEEEERKVDRVVWIKAPKPRIPAGAIPDNPDRPDKPDSGDTQPIAGPTPVSEPGELSDPMPSDWLPYDEEEAA
jgi:hypothetical protein